MMKIFALAVSVQTIYQWHVANNQQRMVILQNAHQRQTAKLGNAGL